MQQLLLSVEIYVERKKEETYVNILFIVFYGVCVCFISLIHTENYFNKSITEITLFVHRLWVIDTVIILIDTKSRQIKNIENQIHQSLQKITIQIFFLNV